MKINILFVYHVSSIGGGSNAMVNIIRELNRNIYCPIVLLKADGPIVPELRALGVKIYFLNHICAVPYNSSLFSVGSIKSIYNILKSLFKLRALFDGVSIDIVHINSMMLYPYTWWFKKCNIKVITHIREHWPIGEHKYQFEFAKKIIVQYSDTIIAINKFSATMLDAMNKTFIVYDWIDFGSTNLLENQDELLQDSKTKYFIYLGGIQKIKGAVEVLSTFSNEVKDPNFKLLFVGWNIGNKNFKSKLKKFLLKCGWSFYSEKIRLIAKKDNRIKIIPATKNVENLLRNAFCLVTFQTKPHAILPVAEATFLGKPSIAASSDETIEYSNNANPELLFRMNDLNSFRSAIHYALDNKEKVTNNAQFSSSFIIQKFDKNSNLNILKFIYEKLYSEKRI